MAVSSLLSVLSSFEKISCKVTNTSADSKACEQTPLSYLQACVHLPDALHDTLVLANCVCTFRMLSRRRVPPPPPHPTPPHPSPVAARRLFDLDCADGSQPTGCQVGGSCRHAVRVWWRIHCGDLGS